MAVEALSIRAPRRLTAWLWGALGLVLFLLALPFVIGSFLPDEAVGRASAVVDAPPAEVWAAIEDVERFPLGTALVKNVRRLEERDAQPAWLEELDRTTWTVTTLERQPERRVVRALVDGERQLDARWEIELEPVPGGTRVDVTQHVHVREGGPQLRFVLRFLGGAGMAPRAYVERLEQALEGAEVGR